MRKILGCAMLYGPLALGALFVFYQAGPLGSAIILGTLAVIIGWLLWAISLVHNIPVGELIRHLFERRGS